MGVGRRCVHNCADIVLAAPETARRYRRLGEVRSPGTTRHIKVPKITDEGYRHIKFHSKKQRKSWAAFANPQTMEYFESRSDTEEEVKYGIDSPFSAQSLANITSKRMEGNGP